MYPDDCGECVVCGCPTFPPSRYCAGCEIPRDDKGRFVKRPESKRWPSTGDRVLAQEYARQDGYTGYGTVTNDHAADDLQLGTIDFVTDAGERRTSHGGWMTVVSV